VKVLLCHTYYTQRGGEDASFEEERDLLRAGGHRVIEYVRRNDELAGVNALLVAARTLWNRRATRDVLRLIDSEQPDVLHATNTFPLLSPALCYAAHRKGVAIVQALRNYRLMCASAYLLRDSRPCGECIGRTVPWAAVAHRCYRESAAASAVVVAMQALHNALGTWQRKVDAFFTLTDFARQKFVEAGLPADRIHVKHNCVSPDPGVGRGDGGYVALVGRLSPEKGVDVALDAWRRDPQLPPLRIAGDGPLADKVKAAVAADPRITWLGHLSGADANRLIGGALALLMPSIWYETFGRAIAEAYAAGTPVIASDLGAMAELVIDGETGLRFEPGVALALAAQVRKLSTFPACQLAAMRERARQEYDRRFTPQQNYQRLIEIYELARHCADARRQVPRLAAARTNSTEAVTA
jgi:glycosyltransferase involved in cell wall biosynthesis